MKICPHCHMDMAAYLLYEDAFDSVEQILPMCAAVIDVKALTPAMAVYQIVNELTRLRERVARKSCEVISGPSNGAGKIDANG